MEQLDCYFRITALNCQIETLERQAQRNSLDAAGLALLEKQPVLRETLKSVYREQARSMFR